MDMNIFDELFTDDALEGVSAITVESVTDDDFDDIDDIFDDDEMDDLDGELECAFVGAAMEDDDDDDCDLCDDDDIEEFDENLDEVMPFDELDDIDEDDDLAEEASAAYYAKKEMAAQKKSAKNEYLTAQNYKEMAKNPKLNSYTRAKAKLESDYRIDHAKKYARLANDQARRIKKGFYEGDDPSWARDSYKDTRDVQRCNGKDRSKSKAALASSRAKESAYDFDFFNEEPNDEVVATESVASLFTTGTPAISRDDYTNLFKPATEAAEDDDLDGELLEEDPDIDDEDLDGYTEGEDYSDAEYDRDEELLDDDD